MRLCILLRIFRILLRIEFAFCFALSSHFAHASSHFSHFASHFPHFASHSSHFAPHSSHFSHFASHYSHFASHSSHYGPIRPDIRVRLNSNVHFSTRTYVAMKQGTIQF